MAVLNQSLVNKLLPILKAHAPVRTGNLRSNGIQGVANIGPNLYLVQIGYPANGGYPATEDYALFTHNKNRTSKGWVTRAIDEWYNANKNEIEEFRSYLDSDEIGDEL